MTRRGVERLEDLDQIKPTSLYTVEEIAPLIRMHPRTVRRWCAEGVFENATTFGRRDWRIPGCDLIARLSHLKGLVKAK